MSSAEGVGDRNRKLSTAGQENVNLISFFFGGGSGSNLLLRSSNTGQVQQAVMGWMTSEREGFFSLFASHTW